MLFLSKVIIVRILQEILENQSFLKKFLLLSDYSLVCKEWKSRIINQLRIDDLLEINNHRPIIESCLRIGFRGFKVKTSYSYFRTCIPSIKKLSKLERVLSALGWENKKQIVVYTKPLVELLDQVKENIVDISIPLDDPSNTFNDSIEEWIDTMRVENLTLFLNERKETSSFNIVDYFKTHQFSNVLNLVIHANKYRNWSFINMMNSLKTIDLQIYTCDLKGLEHLLQVGSVKIEFLSSVIGINELDFTFSQVLHLLEGNDMVEYFKLKSSNISRDPLPLSGIFSLLNNNNHLKSLELEIRSFSEAQPTPNEPIRNEALEYLKIISVYDSPPYNFSNIFLNQWTMVSAIKKFEFGHYEFKALNRGFLETLYQTFPFYQELTLSILDITVHWDDLQWYFERNSHLKTLKCSSGETNINVFQLINSNNHVKSLEFHFTNHTYLSEFLLSQHPTVEYFHCSALSEIPKEDQKEFFDAIARNKTLTNLSLSEICLFEINGFINLVTGILTHNDTLKTLKIVFSVELIQEIDIEILKGFKRSLINNQSIQHLCLFPRDNSQKYSQLQNTINSLV